MLSPSDYRLVSAARTRTWAMILMHILLSAPVGSAVYCSKQKNWAPFWTATLVFIVGCFTWVMDFGFTAGIAAPATSMCMLSGKASDSRRRLGIHDPMEADAMLYNSNVPVATQPARVTGNTY